MVPRDRYERKTLYYIPFYLLNSEFEYGILPKKSEFFVCLFTYLFIYFDHIILRKETKLKAKHYLSVSQ